MAKALTINHTNNFDFLRLFFSSLVIISHSYPLVKEKEILARFTNDQVALGQLAVDCFFIMSGYLIYQSLQRSRDIKGYLWKRVLRLYPALMILLLLTLLFIPFVYNGASILAEPSFWTYLPNGLSLYNVQMEVDGVFNNNPYPKIINGSLWSLSYEFTMYLALILLFPVKSKKWRTLALVAAFLVSVALIHLEPYLINRSLQIIKLDGPQTYRLAAFFLAGSILANVALDKFNRPGLRLILFLVLVITVEAGVYAYFSPLLLPLMVLLVGTLKTPVISTISRGLGDISYGVYIYGFLVQQTLMHYFELSVVQLIIYSLLITFFLAFLSWHLIEKRMLKFKNKF